MSEQMAILTDVTLCIGCEDCVTACKRTYGLAADRPWRWQNDVTDLSATRWTTIVNKPGGRHVRKQCRHCAEPACVSVCPVGALRKTPEGPVIYNGSLCMGCRYCMMACPYGIPRYTWLETVPYVRKCVLCHGKIKSGELKQPACTAACPTGATIFGDRQELLAEAHRRIEAKPDLYINRVFGEHEVGGSNVLYISDIDLGFLGWKPDLGDDPYPAMTWPALRMVPGVFVGVGVAMSATCWLIGRRMKIAAEQSGAGEPSPDTPEEGVAGESDAESPQDEKKGEAIQ
jgi:formate dehydrogenase iron-sulfur subunit